MKTKFLVTALFLSICLTSWGYPKTITKANLSQIRVGQTTEADLLHLFGPPTTRFVDFTHISLDWFRSVPMSPANYLPFMGELTGGLKIEAQQLSVVLSPDGRVLHYQMNSSKDRPREDLVGAAADPGRSSK